MMNDLKFSLINYDKYCKYLNDLDDNDDEKIKMNIKDLITYVMSLCIYIYSSKAIN